jgi:hypothetical protein
MCPERAHPGLFVSVAAFTFGSRRRFETATRQVAVSGAPPSAEAAATRPTSARERVALAHIVG